MVITEIQNLDQQGTRPWDMGTKGTEPPNLIFQGMTFKQSDKIKY